MPELPYIPMYIAHLVNRVNEKAVILYAGQHIAGVIVGGNEETLTLRSSVIVSHLITLRLDRIDGYQMPEY